MVATNFRLRANDKTHLDVDAPAYFPQWVDNDTLLLQEKDTLAVNFWTVNVDSTGLKAVAALHPCCGGLFRATWTVPTVQEPTCLRRNAPPDQGPYT